jgi:hypothetical protein
MSSESLKSAVRKLASVNRTDREQVDSAAAYLETALRKEVALSVAEAVLGLEPRKPGGAAAARNQVRGSRPAGGELAEAVKAGEHFRNAKWASAEMLSSDEAALRLRMSREALNKRRQAGKALGLEAAKRGVRYPRWQFEDRVRPSIAELLLLLSHLDSWGHYLFFTRREPLLGGATPLAALRRGKAAEVIRVARLLVAEAKGD